MIIRRTGRTRRHVENSSFGPPCLYLDCIFVRAKFHKIDNCKRFNMDDNFDTNMAAAQISAVDTAALLGSTRIEEAKDKEQSGPPRPTVKVKVYYLPDTAEVPTFNPKKPVDVKIEQHIASGYGEY